MIKSWVFEFFTSFEDGIDDFEWYLDLWQRFETYGFEGIFFSEHHFFPGRLSPSPNLLIAATAARTKRLRLGAMGQVLPLYEPWRVAEEAAMLDHLCGGRYELGLSSGSGPMEYKALGIPEDEIRPRFAEGLEVLEAALTQPVITHRGRFYNFDHLTISPRPRQQPTPPRWLTGISPGTASTAAARGYKFCTGFLSIERVKELFAAYQAAAPSASPSDLGLRRHVHLADDDAEARELAASAARKMVAIMTGNHAARVRGSAAPADAPRAGGLISSDESISGNPASVAEQIIDQCQRTGAGHIVGYSFGDLARAQVSRNYELWTEVNSILRTAGIHRS